MKNILLILALISFAACSSGSMGGGTLKTVTEDNPQGKRIAEGTTLNDVKHGSWATYHAKNGLVATLTNYVNGSREGIFIKLNDRGNLEEKAFFKNDQFHGEFKKYNRTKVKEEATFVNGLLDGVRKTYYDNGEIQSEEGWKMGKKDGPSKYYNEAGEVKFEQNYKNGEKI